MKIHSRILQTLFVVSIVSPVYRVFAADAFIDRDGRTFTVAIDGATTTRVADRDIKDSTSVVPFTVQWSAKVQQGPRCFRITPTDSRLGEPERIDVLLHEVQSEKPYNMWRNYSAVPSTLENTKTFLTGNGFCPTEYSLSDRLRFSSLPAGQYIAMISFWGKGNWDRQTILFTVERSPAKIDEPKGSAIVAAATAPTECTIVYAAQRTMALHQQLEDKVATGELSDDVFRSFGKDTEDFGALYGSNVPEVCKRLEGMTNKYHLK